MSSTSSNIKAHTIIIHRNLQLIVTLFQGGGQRKIPMLGLAAIEAAHCKRHNKRPNRIDGTRRANLSKDAREIFSCRRRPHRLIRDSLFTHGRKGSNLAGSPPVSCCDVVQASIHARSDIALHTFRSQARLSPLARYSESPRWSPPRRSHRAGSFRRVWW